MINKKMPKIRLKPKPILILKNSAMESFLSQRVAKDHQFKSIYHKTELKQVTSKIRQFLIDLLY